MHVKVRALATGGVLTALAVVCIFLGSVFEFNTVFLLVLAAFSLVQFRGNGDNRDIFESGQTLPPYFFFFCTVCDKL